MASVQLKKRIRSALQAELRDRPTHEDDAYGWCVFLRRGRLSHDTRVRDVKTVLDELVAAGFVAQVSERPSVYRLWKGMPLK